MEVHKSQAILLRKGMLTGEKKSLYCKALFVYKKYNIFNNIHVYSVL